MYIQELRDRVFDAREKSALIKGHSGIALTPFGNKPHAHSRVWAETWKSRRCNSSLCLDDPAHAAKKPSSEKSPCGSQERLHLLLDKAIQETRESRPLDSSPTTTQKQGIQAQAQDRDMIPVVLSEEHIPERTQSDQRLQQKQPSQELSPEREALVYSACGRGCPCICHHLKGICTRCKTFRADAQTFLATRPSAIQKKRRLVEIKKLWKSSLQSNAKRKRPSQVKACLLLCCVVFPSPRSMSRIGGS